MAYYYSYGYPPPPHHHHHRGGSGGPLPHPVLLILIITSISMALSKLLAMDSLFDVSELNVGLLVLPVVILAAVHFISAMDTRRRLCGSGRVPCYRCWNAQCYGC
ncbi:hypothetical protein SAY87_020871 [Trapa incisa]|uniref:Transmembrane protein n=1 Tax=Trapa incisa TaxID=236973 RepID=A0AAN7PQI2_9MYRT|nr:hypothetical protein SAY87_020871 [Trapa incisa]